MSLIPGIAAEVLSVATYPNALSLSCNPGSAAALGASFVVLVFWRKAIELARERVGHRGRGRRQIVMAFGSAVWS